MDNINSIINKALSNFSDDTLPSLLELYDKKIAEIGITKHQADQVLGLDKKTIDPILDYSAKTVDIINLLKLAEFLDIDDTQVLINLYLSKISTEKVIELEKVKKASFIIKNFNLELLKKEGFIKTSINDFEEIEKRITAYFELADIYDYNQKLYTPYFSKTKKSSNSKMLDFWVRSAHYMLKKVNNPNPYNREFLKDLITKIKPFTRDEDNGLIKVIRALYTAGVTVICQPHLSTTQVRGATFIIDDKPCIVITNLNDRYPTIWFALMHELCHVLFDYDAINNGGFHLSFDNIADDIFLNEKTEEFANAFARDYFLNDSQLNYISSFINNNMLIERYAEQNNIHPSIIYAFYCYGKVSKTWAFYQKYIPQTKKMFSLINVSLLDYEKLSESTVTIKNILEPETI